MPSIPQASVSLRELITFVRHKVLLFRGGAVVHSFRQSLDTNLHPPFVDFLKQGTWCEPIFPTVGNSVGVF